RGDAVPDLVSEQGERGRDVDHDGRRRQVAGGGLFPQIMRSKPCLTLDEANQIMTASKAEAAKNGWAVCIAIVNDAGIPLHLERMDGAHLQTVEIATMKARTAAVSRSSTKILEDRSEEHTSELQSLAYLVCRLLL